MERKGQEEKEWNGLSDGMRESVNMKQLIWQNVAILSRCDHGAISRSDVDICRGDHSQLSVWEGSDCAIPASSHAKRAASLAVRLRVAIQCLAKINC